MGIPVRKRSASELQFGEGDRVGPYQVVRRVAPSTYDAEAVASRAPVRIELASDADAALIDIRFTRAQAQLHLVEHPLIAQIIDHGVLSNGRPWVASERPPGTALSDVLSQRRLEPRECTALIYSVAQVLAFAHHRQVVHGSLRPHHLTLSRGAKVSISGWAWLRTPGIPAFGDPANTSVYNPPEHDGQSPIDGRADVYALGAIAYRALTGVFPDVSRDLLDAHDPLGAAIENMLSLDARDRNSAAAIVADLHEQRLLDRAANKEANKDRPSTSSIERPSADAIEGRPPTSPIDVRPSASSIDRPPTSPVRPPTSPVRPPTSPMRPPTNAALPTSPIATDADADTDDRLARAEQEIEQLRAKRPSSPPPRASSSRIEDSPRAMQARASSPRIDEQDASASLHELAQEVLARAASRHDEEPAQVPARSSRHDDEPPVFARASSRLDEHAVLDERPSDRMTAVHGAQDIEQRRTRPMNATPSRGLEQPARVATPAQGIQRTTRPMSTLEYSALDTDAGPAMERARRFVSIQSALHDMEEPQTDRISAHRADQEYTDVAPLEIDETELAPSLGSQDTTDRTSL